MTDKEIAVLLRRSPREGLAAVTTTVTADLPE